MADKLLIRLFDVGLGGSYQCTNRTAGRGCPDATAGSTRVAALRPVPAFSYVISRIDTPSRSVEETCWTVAGLAA